jgi:hypothetical protein
MIVCTSGGASVLYNFFDDFLLDYFFLAGDLLCDLFHAIESVRLLFLVTENVEGLCVFGFKVIIGGGVDGWDGDRFHNS